MTHRHYAAGVLAALLVTTNPVSAQDTSTASLVRENATVKLTEHVWVIPDFNVPAVPNVGIVVGSRATLVVDTGLGPRNGQTIAREVSKVSRNRELYIATTHYHPEHTLGASAFIGAKLVMPRTQQEEMLEVGASIRETFANRSLLNAELLKDVDYPRADMLFEREQRLDLGGVHVRLFTRGPTPLHTRGDTLIFVEEDRVLFTGDVVMSRRFLAANPMASIRLWLETLDELSRLKPNHVVPAHGDLGDQRLIARDREYLAAIQSRVNELKRQGKSVDDAAQVVAVEIAPKYPEWGDPRGSAASVRAAYSEAP